jgi:hypothetical protein
MRSGTNASLHASPPRGRFSVENFPKIGQVAFLFVVILAYIFFLLVAVVLPVPAALAAALLTALCLRSINSAAAIVIASVFALFGWMNSHKGISGDWYWYTQHFSLLEHIPFLSYYGHRIGPYTIKYTEPVYYFISFVVSRISDGSIPVLAWVVTALIYLQHGVSMTLLFKRSAQTTAQMSAALFVALLVGISFTLTIHLVRQEIALAFMVFGVAILFNGYKKSAFIVMAIGLASHNSLLVPFACVVGVAWWCIKDEKMLPWRVLASFLVFVGLGLAFLQFSYDNQGHDDGSVSIVTFAFDIVVFTTFQFVRRKLPEIRRFTATLTAVWLVYLGFIIGVASEPLPLLRMYFYVEGLRMLMLGCITLAFFRIRGMSWVIIPMLLLSIVYVEARLRTSPFWFGGGFVSHILRPFAWFW